jgi:hypothetical protein
MYPHKSRDLFILPRQVAVIILVFMVITTCSMPGILSGKQNSNNGSPLATSEQPVQGSGGAEVPAVMGFVLDPDGAPVAYASVDGEIADSYSAVSGDLTGSASGWLEVSALGYATGYVKPGEAIGGTTFFEARLTPFDVFQPLRTGEEAVLRLGDAAAPVGEVSLTGDDVSALPAYLEAAVYDLVNVRPYPAELDLGEALELKLAIAVEASSDQLEPVPLASGKILALKLFPNASLPEAPVMAIFDAEKGEWEVQADACTPGEEGAILCAVPRFSPLVGFFGPGEEVSRVPGAGKRLFLQSMTNEEKAYQEALGEVESWIRFGDWELGQTGSLDPQWEAGMTSRLESLADKAEAYAAIHQDESGFSHLLRAADPAMATNNQPIADRLVEDAQAIAELMADRLLQEGDCGRFREMEHVWEMVIASGGSQAKADALKQKMDKMEDCDQWSGTIEISFPLTGSQPGLDNWATESGGGDWSENHTVWMTTNVSTFVLKGEDTVKLDFGQVMYGKKDRHDCHNYLTHGGGGSLILKFDGQYDGYTFAVGDLQPEGSTSITYGAHGERWDEEEDECVEIQSANVPAPNYTSVLVHGFSGSPPITLQTILGQADSNDSFSGSAEISNDAFELGIFPSESGTARWHFYHTQKYLPQK